jgi:hypothetical protein
MSETSKRANARLAAIEREARKVDARFGGEGPGRWTFDGEPLEDGPTTDALLSLHDHLNDIERERAAVSVGGGGEAK